MLKGRVAFLQPQEIVSDGTTIPPLGPLYLLAISQKMGLEGRFFDQRLSTAEISDLIYFNPDIIGITSVTPAFNYGVKAINVLKKALPNTVIVMGGAHVSVLPEEAIDKGADVAVVGEGEIAWEMICKEVFARHERPHKWILGTRLDGSHSDKARLRCLTCDELNELPFPAFHLMNLKSYFASTQRHGLYQKGKRALPIMASRGCPFQCTFCAHMMGNVVRGRSVPSVMSEIEFNIRTYGIDEIFFEDDAFFFERQKALEILDRLSKLKPKLYIKFSNGVRINFIDRELLKAARNAGAYWIGFGIESGCTETLQKMHKQLDLDKIREIVALAKEEGFLVGGNCILGYPEETESQMMESISFFYSLRLDSCALVNLIPFPGTGAYQESKRKGYLNASADNWDNFFFNFIRPSILIEYPGMDRERLTKIIQNGYRKIYLRPYMIHNSMRYLTFRHKKDILKGILMPRGLFHDKSPARMQ